MRKAICYLFGHQFKVTKQIRPEVFELQCKRCKAEFGMHTGTKSLLPLDDELKSVHKMIEVSHGEL